MIPDNVKQESCEKNLVELNSYYLINTQEHLKHFYNSIVCNKLLKVTSISSLCKNGNNISLRTKYRIRFQLEYYFYDAK